MESGELSISELADAAGLSRRAIRFYVQQKLLPAPLGLGRGKHYDASHLQRLKRIAELQAAGHSLDAIRRILAGGADAPPGRPQAGEVLGLAPAPGRMSRPRVALSAELWTRLRFAEGVELHFNAARHQPDVEQLLALRDAVRAAFRLDRPAGHEEGSNGDA